MRRWQASTFSALAICFIGIMLLTITYHVKRKFDEMQKLQRLHDYLEELNLLSETLRMLEKSEASLVQDINLLKELARRTLDLTDETPPLEKPEWRQNDDPL